MPGAHRLSQICSLASERIITVCGLHQGRHRNRLRSCDSEITMQSAFYQVEMEGLTGHKRPDLQFAPAGKHVLGIRTFIHFHLIFGNARLSIHGRGTWARIFAAHRMDGRHGDFVDDSASRSCRPSYDVRLCHRCTHAMMRLINVKKSRCSDIQLWRLTKTEID